MNLADSGWVTIRIKRTDASKLQDEYQKLVQGLQDQEVARDEEQWLSNPVLPEDILKEAVPGNIRRAEHFTAFLARFVEYLKVRRRKACIGPSC